MTTNNDRKLKKLLDSVRPGTVCLASWLEEQGISRDLQKYYRKSQWLESVGRGAFKRFRDTVDWRGGLYALQHQASLSVHVGGLTALVEQGYGHYLRLSKESVSLFSPMGVSLPAWFLKHAWQVAIEHVRTSFLPENLGVHEVEGKKFALSMATPERAILECLYLAPERRDLVECYQLLEGLVNLRPKLAQSLLEKCSSVKVKRLFLYMAEKANHTWLPYLDLSKIDLGRGDRSITANGSYVSKYQISVPKELVEL